MKRNGASRSGVTIFLIKLYLIHFLERSIMKFYVLLLLFVSFFNNCDSLSRFIYIFSSFFKNNLELGH
jgi:hypothetical protein